MSKNAKTNPTTKTATTTPARFDTVPETDTPKKARVARADRPKRHKMTAEEKAAYRTAYIAKRKVEVERERAEFKAKAKELAGEASIAELLRMIAKTVTDPHAAIDTKATIADLKLLTVAVNMRDRELRGLSNGNAKERAEARRMARMMQNEAKITATRAKVEARLAKATERLAKLQKIEGEIQRLKRQQDSLKNDTATV